MIERLGHNIMFAWYRCRRRCRSPRRRPRDSGQDSHLKMVRLGAFVFVMLTAIPISEVLINNDNVGLGLVIHFGSEPHYVA
jgi:hypothetical protein